MPASRYDLVVFDLDGTLVDSAGDIAGALNHALAERALPTHAVQAVVPMIGGGVRELVRKSLDNPRATDEPLIDELIASLRAFYRAHPVIHTRLYAGADAALASLPRSIARGVATNKPGGLARLIVERLDLLRHFPSLEWVLGEDDTGAARKPDPAMVETLRARAAASRERTLLVGDSPVDAATARAAGIDFCLVDWGYATPLARAGLTARWRIDSFAGLGEVVGF